MTSWCISIGVFGLILFAEAIHARRIEKLGALLFGRVNRMTLLARTAPLFKALAIAGFTWGSLTLLSVEPTQRSGDMDERPAVDPINLKRVLIVLDVSPSMYLKDANSGKQTRANRAGEVLMNVISRVSFDEARVSVVAFYTGAKPVVIDTIDPNLVANLVDGLPLDQAFEDGETSVMDGIRGAFKLAHDWRPNSTTMIVMTDGDSVPDSKMPPMPPSINRVLVAGVGDSTHGTFIDSHISRQEPGALNQLATLLNGTYQNTDAGYLPSDLLADITGTLPSHTSKEWSKRDAALITIGISALILLALPLLLSRFGIAAIRTKAARNETAEPRMPAVAGSTLVQAG